MKSSLHIQFTFHTGDKQIRDIMEDGLMVFSNQSPWSGKNRLASPTSLSPLYFVDGPRRHLSVRRSYVSMRR